MGVKYRKKVKLAQGINVNISKNGLSSISLGRRGCTANINKKGSVRTTVGLPGSGISYQTKGYDLMGLLKGVLSNYG